MCRAVKHYYMSGELASVSDRYLIQVKVSIGSGGYQLPIPFPVINDCQVEICEHLGDSDIHRVEQN
jgi:hypothetical protein